MTDTSKYLSPLVSCLTCKKEYSAKGIFKHLLNTHDKISKRDNGKGTTKFLIRISCLICKCETNTQSFKAHYNSCIKPKKIKLLKKQKDVSLYVKLNQNTYCYYSYCVICDTQIKNSRRTTCSEKCKLTAAMMGGSKGGKISAAIQNKRSKDEIELFNLCSNHFNNVTSNDTSIADGWDADILLHDHKIAILWNGPWHYKEMGFKNHSLKQVQNRDSIKIREFQKAGWSVEIYEDRFYTPISAFTELKNKVAVTGV